MSNRTVQVKDLDLLLELIVKEGFSYRRLAKEVGCSQTTICLILKGERNPSPNIAKKIAKVLNVSFEHIFFIVNDYKSNQTLDAYLIKE